MQIYILSLDWKHLLVLSAKAAILQFFGITLALFCCYYLVSTLMFYLSLSIYLYLSL